MADRPAASHANRAWRGAPHSQACSSKAGTTTRYLCARWPDFVSYEYEYIRGTRQKSDLLRYEDASTAESGCIFEIFLLCTCMDACFTVDSHSSHWLSPIHGFLRGTPRSGPGAASLVVGAWRDVTLLLCICVMPVPVRCTNTRITLFSPPSS
ncbi:hypothetical protein V8C43DRAFT_319236 [Trichoderma afarasin]